MNIKPQTFELHGTEIHFSSTSRVLSRLSRLLLACRSYRTSPPLRAIPHRGTGPQSIPGSQRKRTCKRCQPHAIAATYKIVSDRNFRSRELDLSHVDPLATWILSDQFSESEILCRIALQPTTQPTEEQKVAAMSQTINTLVGQLASPTVAAA